MDYAIEIFNVTKKFKNVTAVDNLSFKLPKGNIYGFVGPNGAGKTTTIKMLLGLTKPTKGTISVGGTTVTCGAARKLNVGYLPDVPGFYEWMTAGEYLTFCGRLLNMDSNLLAQKTDELLQLTGLKNVKTKIKGYSRGMKQRLGLAQALIGDPQIILLDEPASALDPIGRKEIMDLILSLKGKVTVLFSTHIIADVERVCDTILIMDKGILKVNRNISELSGEISEHVINMSFVNSGDALMSFISKLSERQYTKSVNKTENGNITLVVKDEVAAGKEIPSLIGESSLILRKYEVQTRGLESIFMEVVSK